MTTLLAYCEDTYQFTSTAKVLKIAKNEMGPYVLLDRTIFYPQGGGQPSDQGSISASSGSILIEKVRLQEGEVYHYTSTPLIPFQPEEQVLLNINAPLRLKHAHAHTAGHLLTHVVESCDPQLKGIKGYHFLDNPYVEFQGEKTQSDSDLLHAINQHMQKHIQASLALSVMTHPTQETPTVHGKKDFRTVKIGHFIESPCGGTHVKNLNSFKEIIATKVKKTKENIRISYTFTFN